MKADLHIRLAAREASRDPLLHENLHRATGLSIEKRNQVAETTRNFEIQRRQLGKIREESVTRMEELLEEAANRLEAAGIRVHMAADAAEARRIVTELCEEARLVVKGKSMVSEEIGLNEALEAAGLEVLETDLGEFIVQLRGEAPSHITAPALHLNRRQIGRLFQKKLGIPYSEDPETLTAAARAHLREKFLQADVGITGANFVVADTGTAVIVENEGNITLSSTVPPLHIMITGIEKILPRTLDLDIVLRMLPANGTGQRATSYVSMITAPAPTGSGPQRVHMIFLDNGRRKLAARSDAMALACIRCGACLNVCPLFRLVGGHGYGSVYPGPIGILTTPFLLDGAEGHEPGDSLSDACSLCDACADICPVSIPLPDLIREARGEKAAREPWGHRAAWRLFGKLTGRPRLFRLLGWLGRRLPGAFLRGLTPAWSEGRNLPRGHGPSFRTLLAERRRS